MTVSQGGISQRLLDACAVHSQAGRGRVHISYSDCSLGGTAARRLRKKSCRELKRSQLTLNWPIFRPTSTSISAWNEPLWLHIWCVVIESFVWESWGTSSSTAKKAWSSICPRLDIYQRLDICPTFLALTACSSQLKTDSHWSLELKETTKAMETVKLSETKAFSKTQNLLRMKSGKKAEACLKVNILTRRRELSHSVCVAGTNGDPRGTRFLRCEGFILTNCHAIKRRISSFKKASRTYAVKKTSRCYFVQKMARRSSCKTSSSCHTIKKMWRSSLFGKSPSRDTFKKFIAALCWEEIVTDHHPTIELKDAAKAMTTVWNLEKTLRHASKWKPWLSAVILFASRESTANQEELDFSFLIKSFWQTGRRNWRDSLISIVRYQSLSRWTPINFENVVKCQNKSDVSCLWCYLSFIKVILLISHR